MLVLLVILCFFVCEKENTHKLILLAMSDWAIYWDDKKNDRVEYWQGHYIIAHCIHTHIYTYTYQPLNKIHRLQYVLICVDSRRITIKWTQNLWQHRHNKSFYWFEMLYAKLTCMRGFTDRCYNNSCHPFLLNFFLHFIFVVVRVVVVAVVIFVTVCKLYKQPTPPPPPAPPNCKLSNALCLVSWSSDPNSDRRAQRFFYGKYNL